ncbi:MAG: hypothetical protein ACR2PB_00755 [Desulfocapsaceae bacterium]
MKPRKFFLGMLLLILSLLIPQQILSSNNKENWTVGPWKTQQMFAWGSDLLVVDFGPNGLWKYDGSWTKLSNLDPEGIIALSESKLVVNFGSRGLWKYDGSSWEQIALGTVTADKVN